MKQNYYNFQRWYTNNKPRGGQMVPLCLRNIAGYILGDSFDLSTTIRWMAVCLGSIKFLQPPSLAECMVIVLPEAALRSLPS
jgi:hypothetical protein